MCAIVARPSGSIQIINLIDFLVQFCGRLFRGATHYALETLRIVVVGASLEIVRDNKTIHLNRITLETLIRKEIRKCSRFFRSHHQTTKIQEKSQEFKTYIAVPFHF